MDELTVASTTDNGQSVETTAAGGIAREPDSTVYTEESGSNSASWEHPRSERHLLEERLQLEAVEKDVDAALADSVTVESSDQGEESQESGDVQAAAPAAPEWLRPEHPYFQRMQAMHQWYGPGKIAEIVQPVIDAGIDITPGLANAISELPTGPELLLTLCRDPWTPGGIVEMNAMTPTQAKRTLNEWNQALEQLEMAQPEPRRSALPLP